MGDGCGRYLEEVVRRVQQRDVGRLDGQQWRERPQGRQQRVGGVALLPVRVIASLTTRRDWPPAARLAARPAHPRAPGTSERERDGSDETAGAKGMRGSGGHVRDQQALHQQRARSPHTPLPGVGANERRKRCESTMSASIASQVSACVLSPRLMPLRPPRAALQSGSSSGERPPPHHRCCWWWKTRVWYGAVWA